MESFTVWPQLVILTFCASTITPAMSCPKAGYSLTANYTKQYIRSPNYPDYYPRPSSCKWSLEASQGDNIVFRFLHFDLEASSICYKDSLSIIDGHTGFHYELLSMCGSYDKTHVLHKTSLPAAIVQFTSVLHGDRHTGFEIGYWTEDVLDPDFRSPEYTVINYVMFGISLILLVLVVGAVRILVRVNARIKVRDQDLDQDMTDRRILQIYFPSPQQKPTPKIVLQS